MMSEISAVIVILVFKIIVINASCRWNSGAPGTECLMQCINSNSSAVNKEIEDLYSEDGKESCRQNGIWLRLQTLPYPNNTIGSYWFTAEVKVIELEVSLTYVKSVSADAFNSNAFRTVKKLLFPNFSLELFRNGTFNGLDELEIIKIQGAGGISEIEKGVLDTLNELREFTFEQSLNNNPTISINELTGSEPLSKLEHVKIKYKLTRSINSSTFTGLTNIKYLDLSGCQIESIVEHSFDPISASIEELNLSGNRLTNVPYDLFNTILTNIKIIHINGNSWHCDCELLPFRLIIQQFQDNFTVATCSSPIQCSSNSILESECFDECEIPSTTSTTTETTSTTVISSTTTAISSTTTAFSSTTTEISSTTTELSSTTTEAISTSTESSSTILLPRRYIFLLILQFII